MNKIMFGACLSFSLVTNFPLLAAPVPSKNPGLGAAPFGAGEGVRFRVWAPNAKRVFVVGDFNNWSETSSELAREAGGNFSADVRGAKVGERYKFLIHTPDGGKLWRSDPRAQQVENSVGSAIIYDQNAYVWKTQEYATPHYNKQVIYEMHIGTFNDVPGGAPGTFKSAQAKLDYLKDLGINTVQLLPAAEFPGDYSWGYNPSYIFAPESSYGTPDEMKAFVDAAHARGISVIMDVVHNHHGPSDLPTWCFDGPCYGNGGIYFFNDYRAKTPWGDTRPDYGRPEVRSYIRDSTMMWLSDYRLDGLRFDGTKYIRTVDGNSNLNEGWDLLRSMSLAVKNSQPWKILIAEDFGAGDAMTKGHYWGGAGFDTQWAGEFVHPIRENLKKLNDYDRDLTSIAWSIGQRFNGNAMQRVIYTESHDEVANGQQRLPEAIWPGKADSWVSKKRSTLGAAFTLTSPGIPMLFQGQEFLEDEWFRDTDPLDWKRAKRFEGITNLYRDLIKLRRNWYNNTRGLTGEHVNVHHLNHNDKVLAYHRWDQGGRGDDVVVVVNLSAQTLYDYKLGLPRGGSWKLRFNSDWNGYSSDFGNTTSFDMDAYQGGYDGMGFNGILKAIGPYSVLIYSQN